MFPNFDLLAELALFFFGASIELKAATIVVFSAGVGDDKRSHIIPGPITLCGLIFYLVTHELEFRGGKCTLFNALF